MLGYLRPRLKKADSKIKEQYRSIYCGLCHSLRKNYGIRGIASINYEVTFLLLLIAAVSEETKQVFHGSCCLTPFVRVPFVDYFSKDIMMGADLSILVSSLEIKDNVSDNGTFIWKLFDRLYKKISEKAFEELSDYEINIQSKLKLFYEIETSYNASFDDVLIACGNIIECIMSPLLSFVDGPIAEKLSRIANNVGQWIYLMDACDDYQKDIITGNYNPLRTTSNPQLAFDKMEILQKIISDSVVALPTNENGELLQYFVEVCMPQSSSIVLEKYKRRLVQ